jgi:type IV secretion system protein VirD4
VIPNCFSWRGSLVVLDVKGEAFRATAGYRSRVLGQEVYVFDPAAEDERSHRWNPLQPVQRDSVNRFDQISRQAFMLFPEAASGSTSNADAFWTPSPPSQPCFARRQVDVSTWRRCSDASPEATANRYSPT